MIHLHLIPETPAHGPVWSCAEIRLLRPYQHASLRRLLQVTNGPALPIGRVDVVVLQRGGWPGATLAAIVDLVRAARHRGAKLVYDIDDDLLSSHPVAEIEDVLGPQRPRIRFLLREADLVIAATATLANRLQALNPRRIVWRNALDEALLPDPVPLSRSADIGYFGTHSHLPDLMAIVASLQAAASAVPDARIELCGISDDPRLRLLFAGRLATSLRPVQGHYANFHRMLAHEFGWRVGLAPLLGGPFNHGKSDIKVLDYAAAGIPAVVADQPAYDDWDDGKTVLRATPDGFGQAVVRLLHDEDLSRSIARQARERLLTSRVLSVAAPLLGTAIENLLS
jgi:glycosyltransferase involved in cell wall biosynthesis